MDIFSRCLRTAGVFNWDLREAITALVEGDLFQRDILLQLRFGSPLQHMNLESLENINCYFIWVHLCDGLRRA